MTGRRDRADHRLLALVASAGAPSTLIAVLLVAFVRSIQAGAE